MSRQAEAHHSRPGTALARDDQGDPLHRALRQCRAGLLLLVGFGLFVNLLFLVAPLYMLQVFDRVLSSQRLETLLALTLIAGLALIVLGALEAVRGRIQTRMANWLDRNLSGELIRASVGAGLAGFDANAQALRDLGAITGFLSGGMKAILDAPWTPLFIVVLWLLHPWIGWFAAAFALVLFVLAMVNELAARRPAQQANGARVANENLVEQAIRNAEVLQAMGMLPRFLGHWDMRNAAVLEQNRRAGDRNAALLGASRFVRMFAQVGVLGLGAFLVINGELTAGGMIAGSILLGRALAPLEQILGAWRGMVSARAAGKRLKVLVTNMAVRERPMRLPAPRGKLVCEDLWFSPRPGMEPTLKGIDLVLEPGEAMALMGPSAAGKTTLCRVLVGSWKPNRGAVRLDGSDVHHWEADVLGPHIGYLPQDVELFAATVKENIARLDPDPDPVQVIEAAEAAGVHQMVLELPQGYDTPVGPAGVFLSGGQRQRIGLARALFGKPKLIVLDEPNANLDTAGEDALVAAIEAAKQWRSTVVLVTHNARMLRPVDKIMVLKDGEKQLLGPRSEVLRALRPKPVQTSQPAATNMRFLSQKDFRKANSRHLPEPNATVSEPIPGAGPATTAAATSGAGQAPHRAVFQSVGPDRVVTKPGASMNAYRTTGGSALRTRSASDPDNG